MALKHKDRHNIHVAATTTYLPEQSDPDMQEYAFAYTITITNLGSATAQLLNRHWIITDANGSVQEVRGEGVIGKQPTIEPGTTYSYSSGAIIATEIGHMQGSYEMLGDQGDFFDADIPAFTLAKPNSLH
jgi:ApaG protein